MGHRPGQVAAEGHMQRMHTIGPEVQLVAGNNTLVVEDKLMLPVQLVG